MKKQIMAIMLACMCLLCGCTESTIIHTNRGGDSEVPLLSEDGLAWAQIWEDLSDIYVDEDEYPFAESINGGLFDEENMFKFFLLLKEPISREEAGKYATAVMKGLGELMAEQNPQYTPPSETSYGSYLDAYDIYVMVAVDDVKEDVDSWILEDTVKAGHYREFGSDE